MTPDEHAAAPAEFPEPQRLSVDRTTAGQLRQHSEMQWTRSSVREQAAEVAASVGPAALEIVAEFRARRWATTAALTDDPVRGEQATARCAEWRRIAASVSLLADLTWR